MRGRRQPERNVRVDRPDRCQAVGAGEHPLQRASGLPVGLVVLRSGRSGHARRVHQPGLRTWTSTQSDSQLTMLTISCPSTSLCVARRPARELLVSTNPTRRCRRLGGDACRRRSVRRTDLHLDRADRRGYGTAVHILDTATRSRSGSSPSAVLSGLSLPGYTLTWMHAGTPETASLH